MLHFTIAINAIFYILYYVSDIKNLVINKKYHLKSDLTLPLLQSLQLFYWLQRINLYNKDKKWIINSWNYFLHTIWLMWQPIWKTSGTSCLKQLDPVSSICKWVIYGSKLRCLTQSIINLFFIYHFLYLFTWGNCDVYFVITIIFSNSTMVVVVVVSGEVVVIFCCWWCIWVTSNQS